MTPRGKEIVAQARLKSPNLTANKVVLHEDKSIFELSVVSSYTHASAMADMFSA
jgi:hypothetical protein